MSTTEEKRQAYLRRMLGEDEETSSTDVPSITPKPSEGGCDNTPSFPPQKASKNKERENLLAFQTKYLQPLRLQKRKAVYITEETLLRLDFVVRKIGERGVSISGYVEQVLREHLDRHRESFEVWRKL